MAKHVSKFKPRRSKKAGMSPGTLIYTGDHVQEQSTITIYTYDEIFFEERVIINSSDFKREEKKTTSDWIIIKGVHDTKIIEKVGQIYNLHPLLLEDIVSTHQRPKVDEYDNCIFVVARIISWDGVSNEIHSEQISFVLLPNVVLTFIENNTGASIFNTVIDRLRNGKGRIRKSGSDYLLHALLDSIVDNYFLILEKLGDIIEEIELEIMNNPNENTIKTIHRLKRELIFLKRSVWPLREVIVNLQRDENLMISQSNLPYFRDLYDHIIHVNENIEIYRDILTGLGEMYLSSVSNRMNLVMKLLTIIATIFIPLTFIVGIYGMNFKFMPEIEWEYGYPMVWVIMIIITLGMILLFRKKRWI